MITTEKARALLRVALRNGEMRRPDHCDACKRLAPKNAVGAAQIWAVFDTPDQWRNAKWRCVECYRETGAPKRVERSTHNAPDAAVRIMISIPRAVSAAKKRAAALDPNTIHVCGRDLLRGDTVVRLDPTLKRLFLVMAARLGVIISTHELVDLIWGDDEDGGPMLAHEEIRRCVTALRDAGAALGFRIETMHDRGYMLAPVGRREMEIAA